MEEIVLGRRSSSALCLFPVWNIKSNICSQAVNLYDIPLEYRIHALRIFSGEYIEQMQKIRGEYRTEQGWKEMVKTKVNEQEILEESLEVCQKCGSISASITPLSLFSLIHAHKLTCQPWFSRSRPNGKAKAKLYYFLSSHS